MFVTRIVLCFSVSLWAAISFSISFSLNILKGKFFCCASMVVVAVVRAGPFLKYAKISFLFLCTMVLDPSYPSNSLYKASVEASFSRLVLPAISLGSADRANFVCLEITENAFSEVLSGALFGIIFSVGVFPLFWLEISGLGWLASSFALFSGLGCKGFGIVGAEGVFGNFGGIGAVGAGEMDSLAFPLSIFFAGAGIIMVVSVVIIGSLPKLFLNLKSLSSVISGVESVSILYFLLLYLFSVERKFLSI